MGGWAARRTPHGHALDEAASALQKAMRRNLPAPAVYFALQVFASGAPAHAWRRVLTTAAEDCAGPVAGEVEALYRCWLVVNAGRAGPKGRVFLSRAVLHLCAAPKNRDADHAGILVHDRRMVLDEAEIAAIIAEAAAEPEPDLGDPQEVPAWALDVHTAAGRRRGATKADFLLEEHAALSPRVDGVFDDLLAALERRRSDDVDDEPRGS